MTRVSGTSESLWDTGKRLESDWGSSGRRFKSCQPDHCQPDHCQPDHVSPTSPTNVSPTKKTEVIILDRSNDATVLALLGPPPERLLDHLGDQIP
jgi:hypothetical protein